MKMPLVIVLGVVLSFLEPLAGASGPASQTYALWSGLLKKHVTLDGSRSRVDYAGIKKDPSELNAYVAEIASLTRERFDRMDERDRLAFLINAYNALTVKLIVDHYPVKSIRDLGGLFSSPWKIQFFKLFGEKHSLDDIEQEMIRKNFSEPRIHFALVCASKGCPALRDEPYVGARLDEQLEAAARVFLRDPTRNRFVPTEDRLYVSSIFKWYGPDFEKKFGSVRAFLGPRMSSDPKAQQAIASEKTSIHYESYDWSLNGAD